MPTQSPVDRVKIRVPATTANLGPGYDVLGMALNIWMEVTVERAPKFTMEVYGEGADIVHKTSDNLIYQSMKKVFDIKNLDVPPVRITVRSSIPFAAGCGSSSAACVAGLLAGLSMTGSTMPTKDAEELLQHAVEIEGHPDNAAPAIYGGVQIGYQKGKRFATERVSIPPGLICVLFIPIKKMKKNTHATRTLVPTKVPLTKAVFNMSRTALLTLGLQTANPQVLRLCQDEKFHQQQRADALFPHMNATINAAMQAGAAHTFLSGAGPTICAFVFSSHGELTTQPSHERIFERVGEAMVDAAKSAGVEGFAVITHPSEVGAHIVDNGGLHVDGKVRYAAHL